MADLGIALSVAQTLFAALGCSPLKEVFSAIGYKSDLEGLKMTVKTIKSVLLDAGNKMVLSESELEYIERLKDAVYDADDLFDQFVTLVEFKHQLKDDNLYEKVRKFFSSENSLKVAYSMSRAVKKIRKELNTIADDHTRYGFSVATQLPLRSRREETYSYVYAHDVIGREDDASEVIQMLLESNEDDVGFVTIVGVGGLGKTTLTKLVFGDERIKLEFPLRLWVCVSDQDGILLDVKEILSKILESAGYKKPDNSSSMELVQSQYQQNLGGKKYLLVLDDIWNENAIEWLKLREFLMIGGRGSMILATTRSKETARILGNGTHTNTYELKGLSQYNSWQLFEMTAFREASKPRVFIEIGEKIVDKCSNLPLAIMVAGSLLYGQPIDKWLLFEKNGFVSLSNGMNEIMSILKFSYDHLEPSLKSCFTYCALFPKDFIINKQMIMNLWEAQGYIVPFVECQGIENASEEHFSILLQRCFFQDVEKNEYGDVESFKIHDLMHDLAKGVSKKDICVTSSSMPNLNYAIRHIFEAKVNIKEDDVIKSKLRSYLWIQKQFRIFEPYLVSRIVENWVCLRALALSGLCIKTLPDTMGNLLHLRYLNLANNRMKKLPASIVKLYNLQTLNLSNCFELNEWPKDFSKLVNLTHLYRDQCDELNYMPAGMSKLTSLRVLTDFVVVDESVSGVKRVGQLEDLRVLAVNLKGRIFIQFHENFTSAGGYSWEGSCLESGEHLKEVEICFPDEEKDDERAEEEEDVMKRMQPHPNLRKFELHFYSGKEIGGWGRTRDNWAVLFPNLVYIKLWQCYRLQQLPLLSKLQHLKSLHLRQLENLKYMEEEETSSSSDNDLFGLGVSEITFFPSLESLEIDSLLKLKGWWRADRSSMLYHPAFPRLSHLTIENCPDLTSFPHCLSLQTLDLRLTNKALRMTTTREVYSPLSSPSSSCNDETSYLMADLDCAAHLKTLAPLHLTSLNIRCDHKIENLLEVEDVFKSCSSFLHTLTINSCDNLRSVFGGLKHLTALRSLSLVNCKELKLDEEGNGMPWRRLQCHLRFLSLQDLYKMEILPKGMLYLTSLYNLEIEGCTKLKALPEWLGCFQSLRGLRISNCPALKSLPQTMLNLISLQQLHISYCPELSEICQQSHGKDWPKIQHIPSIIIR